MAQRVIDHLEPVQIHQEDRQLLLTSMGLGDGDREAIFQQQPVGETSQGVMIGLMLEPLFSFLSIDRRGQDIGYRLNEEDIFFAEFSPLFRVGAQDAEWIVPARDQYADAAD